ncbi:hypothetical protein CF70_022595 [Cupriavidus sp. SK-3]|nr:hypothetical protein CF70_022595 [Cupriavidus sp. SK-3]
MRCAAFDEATISCNPIGQPAQSAWSRVAASRPTRASRCACRKASVSRKENARSAPPTSPSSPTARRRPSNKAGALRDAITTWRLGNRASRMACSKARLAGWLVRSDSSIIRYSSSRAPASAWI